MDTMPVQVAKAVVILLILVGVVVAAALPMGNFMIGAMTNKTAGTPIEADPSYTAVLVTPGEAFVDFVNILAPALVIFVMAFIILAYFEKDYYAHKKRKMLLERRFIFRGDSK